VGDSESFLCLLRILFVDKSVGVWYAEGMNIQDNNTMYAGGYYEQGDPTRLRLGRLHQAEIDAEIEAHQFAEPNMVVVQLEVVAVERVAPVGSKPKSRSQMRRLKAQS